MIYDHPTRYNYLPSLYLVLFNVVRKSKGNLANDDLIYFSRMSGFTKLALSLIYYFNTIIYAT